MKNSILMIFVVNILIFPSCQKEENRLIGRWEPEICITDGVQQSTCADIQYEFNRDGSYKKGAFEFGTWEYNSSSEIINFKIGEDNYEMNVLYLTKNELWLHQIDGFNQDREYHLVK